MVSYNSADSQTVINHADPVWWTGLLCYWPEVSPTNKKTIINPVSYAWLHSCMRSAVSFYAFAFAAGSHRLYLTEGRNTTALEPLICQSYRTKAISLVRSQVDTLEGLPSDDLIISILILAAHGAHREQVPDYSPPKSPLARLQVLDYYASLEYEAAHQSALYHLVEQRGGLEKLELDGLPRTLQLYGLTFITTTFLVQYN